MKELIINNYSWIFSGIGVTAIILIYNVFSKKPKNKQGKNEDTSNINTNTVTLNNYISDTDNKSESPHNDPNKLEVAKKVIKILFIDDDTKFKVVTILKKSGWQNTKAVKDIESWDTIDVKESDIFFVDIQGVGLALACKDEGLGLALSLKRKYPEKKVVIYSAETKGERFHEGLRMADSFLPKNAEPYEFLQLVEQFTPEIMKKYNGKEGK